MRAIQLTRRKLFSQISGAYAPLAVNALYLLCGAVVSHGAVFGSYAPFGAAFCAAVPYNNMLSAVIGSMIGYIILYPTSSFRYVASVVTVFVLRRVFGDIEKISRSKLFSAIAAAAPLLCTGTVVIMVTGKGRQDIIMCITESLLAAVGAYFLSQTVNLSAGSKGVVTFDQQEIACIVMTACIFLLSANTVAFGGISVGRILAVTVVLFCAYYGSVAGGCIGGVATGIVFGIATDNADIIPASYSFGGLMAGLFAYWGKVGSAVVFMLCACIISLRSGVTAQTVSLFYETTVACLIFIFVPKEFGEKLSVFVSPGTGKADNEALKKSVIMRLDLSSKALKSISGTVNAVAQKMKEYYTENIDGIYEKCVEINCTRCGMRALCRQNEERVEPQRFERVTPVLNEKGSITPQDVTGLFNEKCCKSGEMAEDINRLYKNYRSYLVAEARITQIRGVVASQFSGLGDILAGFKNEFERFERFDPSASERVCAYLKAHGYLPIDCSCRYDRRGRISVEIELIENGRKIFDKGSFSQEISKICGRRLEPPHITNVGSRKRALLCEKPKFDIQIGTSQHICGDRTLCGDSFNYFQDGQGRFVAVISDGMGTGGRATVDSGMAVSIITKLLKAGFDFDCALSVANSALMVKSRDESLATVDIASVDLFSGELFLMKAGAPVTFVRKSGKIHRIEPSSLPAGILTDIKLSHDDMSVKDGDIVVMITDGAVSVSDEWIGAMMRDFEGSDIQELVNDIIDEATIGSKLCRDDDITVIGMRIMDN
ncbi:MAG: SpoIIE family protein phosphatase [Acutalibacteraceae bacterium]|nr:SpoIIE family protein phosphatase [Acutalibacteraceae bacterium]